MPGDRQTVRMLEVRQDECQGFAGAIAAWGGA